MKILIALLTVFFFCDCTYARNVASGSKGVTLIDTNKSPVYIIDDKVTDDSLAFKKIKPADIFEVSIVHDSATMAHYGSAAENGAMKVTTKKYAEKLYQDKLSIFSKQYKSYLQHKGDDSNLLYVINNVMLQAGKNKSLRELYELTTQNIKKVNFRKDSRFKSDATVVITTKDAAKE